MGNLSIDMLMRLDREKLIEVPVKDVKADRLSQLMGQDVTVEIKALSGDTYMDLLATATNKKGKVDMSRAYRAQALIVVEAVQNPSLKDKELQEHFGALLRSILPRSYSREESSRVYSMKWQICPVLKMMRTMRMRTSMR